MTAAILVVIVPSFLWSVHLTGANPERAFFVSTTRLWELGIGAFVAIGSVLWTRIPRTVSIPLGWAGLAAVLAGGLLIDSSVAWPGYAALLPTLGSAAVIVAGFTSGPAGPAGILSLPAAVWVGGVSYSLYLWHWPPLVSASADWDGLSPLAGTAVALFSVVPAYLSYRLVENPLRFSRQLSASNRLTLSLGANFSAIGVVAGLLLVLAVPLNQAPTGGQVQGAAAITSEDRESGGDRDNARSDDPDQGEGDAGDAARPGTVASLAQVDGFVPAATEATDDVPGAYAQECQVDQVSPEPVRCEYGDPESDVTIAVVGDSKILQWYSPLREIAEEQGWHVVSYTKSACGFHTGLQIDEGAVYTSCDEWSDRVQDLLIDLKPDMVLTTHRHNYVLEDANDLESKSSEALVEALVEPWQELKDNGIPVVAMLDNPSPTMSVYECVAENPDNLEACTFDRQEGIERSSAPQYLEAAERVPGTRTIDIRDAICPEETCVPVIGGVLVYRQTSHITDTYARSLKPVLEEELVPVVEELAG